MDKNFNSLARWAALSLFIAFVSNSLTLPHLQAFRESVGCDALCYGGYQSLKSFLSLFGSTIVGRLSDFVGRFPTIYGGLLASLLSFSINYFGNSKQSFYLSTVPSSLFNQNFSVYKALIADYCNQENYDDKDRTMAMGILGMTGGVSIMIGPLVGASIVSTYREALVLSMALTLFSAAIVHYFVPRLPSKSTSTSTSTSKSDIVNNSTDISNDLDNGKNDKPLIIQFQNSKNSMLFSISSYLNKYIKLSAASSPGIRLLFFMRFSMGIAYHIFATVWSVVLREKFGFQSKDHAFLMSWIGLCYALSQGFLAKQTISYVGSNRITMILQVCSVILGCGRIFAMFSHSIPIVYTSMAFVIIALGVTNTIISTSIASISIPSELGSVYGLMDSCESLSGIIGPALGGYLYTLNNLLPMYAVMFMYSLVFLSVTLYFEIHITRVLKLRSVSEESKSKQQ